MYIPNFTKIHSAVTEMGGNKHENNNNNSLKNFRNCNISVVSIDITWAIINKYL